MKKQRENFYNALRQEMLNITEEDIKEYKAWQKDNNSALKT